VVIQTAAPSSAGPGPVAVLARPGASPSPAAIPLSILAGRSGADVRLTLDTLLQEHAFLLGSALDAASNSRLDDLAGAEATLDQSSITLAEIVGAANGQPAAETFVDAWRGTVNDVVHYAQGQRVTALADLDQRRASSADALAAAGIAREVADAVVAQRLESEIAIADALVGHDGAQGLQRVRALAAASDDLGGPLASAVAARESDLAPQTTEGADVDVRLRLAIAMGEHVYLSGIGLDAAADNRGSDLANDTDAVGQNASAVGAELGSVYGGELGNNVADRLRAESVALWSVASRGDRQQAAASIDRLRGELDGLLAAANPLLPPGLMNQQLRASDQPLLTAADAFAARDYATAYARLREAARQMRKPADTLALSIIDRYPGRYLSLPTPEPG
jgi:hypothetical protein